jgi:isopenicillin N synthase-like dioxygenase
MADQIPVVDLEAALGDGAPAGLLDAVRRAAEQPGIIQVVNHGIPADLLDGYSQRIARLLGQPRPEKARLASPGGHPYRGWRQWPDDLGRLELERYNVAQFDTPADAVAAGVPAEYAGLFGHPNVWPPDDPELRGATFRYIEAAGRLAGRVLRLYARALGVPADTFRLGALPHLRLTTNDYPAWSYPDTGSDEDKLLLLEHADDSVLTVLRQQGDYQGLQGQLPDGSWLPVPLVPGALLVFSGMLLTRWTGGRLRAGRHRVVAGGTRTGSRPPCSATRAWRPSSGRLSRSPVRPAPSTSPFSSGTTSGAGSRTTWATTAVPGRSPRGARAGPTSPRCPRARPGADRVRHPRWRAGGQVPGAETPVGIRAVHRGWRPARR